MTRETALENAKPILFNTDMVRAILDGKKTVTRRKIGIDIVNRCDMEKDGTLLCFEDEYGDHIRPEKLCRYQQGDILYVRETWCQIKDIPHWYQYYRSDGIREIAPYEYVYRADNLKPHEGILPEIKWHPSLHMPKEAARIFLKVTDVRVERLQEISKSDICREGIVISANDCAGKFDYVSELYFLFQNLWNSTIKKSEFENYGWEANPWVWVIEFEKLEVGE